MARPKDDDLLDVNYYGLPWLLLPSLSRGNEIFIQDLKNKYKQQKAKKEEEMSRVYNIRIQSDFVLTPTEIKKKLGIGYRVLSTEVEKDQAIPEITDNVSAMEAIIRTGYRALARANHPDLGGNAEVMIILTKTKKELEALLQEVSL